ncbi:hypothetical protein A3G12_01550 [Candidatus Kaiserbacteria bacterium RIFCSPLOWO2_12_FULL_54_10]|nr:MAG: hypothetical protein A3G12_01550 [Candidatus Kaiserbacteria bacterium RIFCSPLOWO2_12_FULL_54_10]
MFEMFIERQAQLWSAGEDPPPRADLVAMVAFGATGKRLTRGAQATLEVAVVLAARYRNVRVASGEFTLSPSPGLEWSLKQLFFKDPIFAGEVISTIEEAEKIRAVLPPGFVPEDIVVVTDQWHSRSAKRIWEWVWRDVKPNIHIVAVPSSATIDAESPMGLGRRHWTWALINVLRDKFLECFPERGIPWMKKLRLRQPVAH